MSYAKYREWLVDSDTPEELCPFEEWLAGTYPADVGLQRQLIVAATVAGDLPKRGVAANIINEVVLNSEDDLRAGLAAIARSRMSKLASTLALSDQVDALIHERSNPQEMQLPQLYAYKDRIDRSRDRDTKLIVSAAKISSKTGLEGAQFNVQVVDQVLIGDSDAKGRDVRDRVRAVVDAFLKVTRNKDNGTTTISTISAEPKPWDSRP